MKYLSFYWTWMKRFQRRIKYETTPPTNHNMFRNYVTKTRPDGWGLGLRILLNVTMRQYIHSK